jgi:HEAT repeat protein
MENTLFRIAGPAVPALIDVLTGPNSNMRVCAAAALGRIGPAARASVPSLIRAINSSDTDRDAAILRRHAVLAVGRIGPEAKAVVPSLNRLLDKAFDVDREVENADAFDLVIALDGIGDPPVRKLLDRFLREGNSQIASQLAWLGSRAGTAIPSLRRALTDPRTQVRISAAIALASIDPSCTESIPALIEALKHVDDNELDVAEAEDEYQAVDVASNCLGQLGPWAKEAVPALVAAMTRDYKEVFVSGHDPQVSAVKALRRIGADAKTAIPALVRAVQYQRVVHDPIDDGEYRECTTAAAAAVEALSSSGAAAKAAVPVLIEAAEARENTL